MTNKMMKNRRMIALVVIGLVMNYFGVVRSFAADAEESGGFSYEIIQPDSQHDTSLGYFDLRLKADQTETAKVKLRNTSDKEMEVVVGVNGAKTNGNGVIEYGNNDLEKDASLKTAFEDIVTGPEKVTLPANSEETLELAIKMPKKSFDGYISGGIILEEVDQENSNEGMVVNKFAYIIGMLLSESDSDAIQPDLQFNKVYPKLSNFRNAIMVSFSNVKPVYTEDMTIDVQIMEKKNDQVIYESKKAGMRMAPNSLINYPVQMNGEKMAAGTYRAKIMVTTKAGGQWDWLEEFTITDEEADKYNAKDVSLVQEKGIDWKLVIIIVGAIVGSSAVAIVIVYSIKKKQQIAKRATNKNARKNR